VDQFSAMLRGGDHHNLCVYGSPLRSQTALFPVLRQLKREAGISNAQDDADKLAAITRLFAGVAGPQDQAARLIAGLLGVKGAEVEGLSAVQRRERTIAALLDYLSALARQKPLLLIFEDTHWMDPTSLDLLDRIVAQIEPQRILLLVCARPDYQPAWADYAAVTSLNLNRLGVREGAAMIDSIARRKALPASLAAQILDRSDGVPLFIEELTKSVLESGALIEQADGYALRGSLPAATLPGSLQASLVARLDRLPAPAKQLAQLGAVIGREFSQRVLQDVTELSRDAMEDCLAKLIASGLIHRRGRGQDARYIFKHALIQDAAYSTLLKGRRQEIHAAIARALLEKYPAVANAQPEVLAHHLTCAADYAPAVQFWLAAGRMQIRSSADLEGIQHLQRGLELVDYVNDPGLRRELELMLHAALIGPLVAVEGANSPRVAVACERGLALIPAGSPYIFPFTYGQFTHLVSTGQLGQALDVAQRFTTLAEQAGYEPGAVIGHRLRGMALLGLGRLQAARETLETSLALYDPDRDDNITYLFGQNAKVNCQAVLSLTLYLLGEEDRAKQIGQDAIRTANRLKHPHSMAIAISYFGCWVLALCGERAEMARQAERLVIIAEEYGLRALGVVGQFFVAWAQYLGGGGSAAIGAMESFIHRLDETGFRLSLSQFIGLLADAQLASGRLTEARASCNWAKQMMEDTDERWFEPELICLDAQIAYAAGEIGRDEAAARFQAGADCARRLSSPPLEERCKRRLQTALASQMA
jgi:tetratricopeptide (TPR) repeat protein